MRRPDLNDDALCACSHLLYMHEEGTGPCVVCSINQARSLCHEFRAVRCPVRGCNTPFDENGLCAFRGFHEGDEA